MRTLPRLLQRALDVLRAVRASRQGAAMVEFAAASPVFVVLLLGVLTADGGGRRCPC